MSHRAVLLPLLGLATVACFATANQGEHAMEQTEQETAETPGQAIVLDREVLKGTDERLLDALLDRIPSVSANAAVRGCPRVSLRGPLLGTAIANPLVYMNGTRMTDTCILTNIRTPEIEQVEVYPRGFTERSGYVTHPHGLILVFTRRI